MSFIKILKLFIPIHSTSNYPELQSIHLKIPENKIEITKESDFESIRIYLQDLGIPFKEKSIYEVNLLIDEIIELKLKEYKETKYPNVRTALVAQLFYKDLEYKNLINLKWHIINLCIWLCDTS